MTAIGKNSRVVCLHAGWENLQDSSDNSGPAVGDQCLVADAVLISKTVWLNIVGHVGWFSLQGPLGFNFRPVDQVDEMAERCAKLEDPDAVDEKYMEVEKVL